jgi:hypothetical protein
VPRHRSCIKDSSGSKGEESGEESNVDSSIEEYSCDATDIVWDDPISEGDPTQEAMYVHGP